MQREAVDAGRVLDEIMRVIDKLGYKGYSTIVKITKEVEDYLVNNNIDLKLSSRIHSVQRWYEELLFYHLKDKNHKNFELIYCGIITAPKEYESKENIMSRLKIMEEDILFDGSVTLLETKPNYCFVRWIVVKA